MKKRDSMAVLFLGLGALQIGVGHYFRNVTEHMMFAVRGDLQTLENDQP